MLQRHVGLQQQQQGRVGLGRVLSHNVCNKQYNKVYGLWVLAVETVSCLCFMVELKWK